MKHALIITHAGSGGTLLCRILSTNMKVRCFGRTGVVYFHPSVIHKARTQIDKFFPLKSNRDTDWYIDKLVHNHEFTCKSLYDVCKFIYMVRSPLIPLSTLVARGYTPKGAETYYLFRLRRMCEMARHTDGVLLTYEDLVTKRCFPLLKNALGLSSILSEFTPLGGDDYNLCCKKIINNPVEPVVSLPEEILRSCETGYKKYLNFLEKKTGLVRYSI